MKLITFTVPCYNSQAYMRHCLDALLTAGEQAEIIIVDDGSSDSTGRIADEYEKAHPTVVRAVHQENGGHGEGVNTGLRLATGQYFKVVDSDDWLDIDALSEYMRLLGGFGGAVDVLISNYVYEKQGAKHRMVMRYGDACPKDRVFGWDDLGSMRIGEILPMHALTYRTQLLRDCGLSLPKHTFYVDNLVAYLPMPSVKTMYYADINLYRYFIGRADQSVSTANLIKRQDQQLEVMRRLIVGCRLAEITHARQRAYMQRYIEVLMAITSIIFIRDGSDEALRKKDAIWACLDEVNPETAKWLRRGVIGIFCGTRSLTRMWIAKQVYTVCNRIYGFTS